MARSGPSATCSSGALVNGGFLHPYKARVLLRLLVAAGAGHEHCRRAASRPTADPDDESATTIKRTLAG